MGTDHNCWDLCPTAAKDHHAKGIHDCKDSNSYVAVQRVAVVDLIGTICEVGNSYSIALPH